AAWPAGPRWTVPVSPVCTWRVTGSAPAAGWPTRRCPAARPPGMPPPAVRPARQAGQARRIGVPQFRAPELRNARMGPIRPAARRDREVYVGPWLPEPVASDPLTVSRPGPEELAELSSSLTLGFLHVLETLSPVERVVFVLADVFDVPFKEIAGTVGKSPDACRQTASRARRRVHDARPRRYCPPDDEAARLVAEMLAATTAGDIDGLVKLLAEDAVLVSDGGAHKRAARHPIRGRDRLARFMANIGKRYD